DCTTPPLAWDRARVASPELAARLNGYAERWAKLRHDACVAGALPPERVACFETCKASFATIVASLDVPPAEAWKRVAALPPAEACRGDEAIRLSPPGPKHQELMQQLARASFDPKVSLDALAAQAADDAPARLQIALVRAQVAMDIDREVAGQAINTALGLA